MMFPEIAERVRSVATKINSRFDSTPITLNLKAAGGIDFDAVNAGWYAHNGFPGFAAAFGGGMPAWSGESVTLDTALANSVVWACNRIISESVGFIPAVMMRQVGERKEISYEKPQYSLLVNAPNEEITAQAFTEALTSHCLLAGGGFAQIFRRSGTGEAREFNMLTPQMVTPDREKTGKRRLVYVVKEGSGPGITYTVERGKPHDILHLRGIGWDGVRGYPVVQMGRQSIGTSQAAERNVARFWANGGRVPYLLEMRQRFKTDADFQKFRADWEQVYSEPHKAPILEDGTTYKQIGQSMADAQALETRQYHIQEICRWFTVSPHMVGDLSRATFSNIEHLTLQFVKMTLNSWLTRWEQDTWRCVLTPEEKAQGYFWRHDVRALLRGDFKSRMEGYASALQNGHLSIDEVRDQEGLNALPNGAGAAHHIQLNMAALPKEDGNAAQPAALVRMEQ